MKLPVLLCALTLGCWPSHSFRDETIADSVADSATAGDALDDTTATEDSSVTETDGAMEVLPPPTTCGATSTKANGCDVLRAFTAIPVVDGVGDEFCTVDAGVPENPPRTFSLADADRTEPATVPAGLTEKAEIRAGLSSFGVHVFVHVDDPSVVVDLTDYTQGDAIEIFLRGNKSLPLNGDLETDFAQVIVIIPPTATTSARAAFWLRGMKSASVDASRWAARRVKGGWEAELHYPWSALMNEASPGQVIGFDLALDVKDDPSAKTRAVRAIMHEETITGGSPPCTTFGFATPDPQCDDRLWCLAKAYVP
ncbi:MAG: sugar-binding protein [Polyangiales bacterium]